MRRVGRLRKIYPLLGLGSVCGKPKCGPRSGLLLFVLLGERPGLFPVSVVPEA